MTASHPALYPGRIHIDDYLADPVENRAAAAEHGLGGRAHFVPEGWEETDRGICPCGELVAWNEEKELWIPDRSLVAFVLTAEEAEALRVGLDSIIAGDAAPILARVPDLAALLALETALNREVIEAEPDDGNTLIAGVLYDRETLEEAPTP